MQKISSYLYPNRIQLLADLAGFNVEYTNVYQRTVKIYKGVDNVLEFDIKNADQKRIELVEDPTITDLQLNVMDASGFNIGNYEIDVNTGLKGIAKVVIPADDTVDLKHQYLTYSVTASKDTYTIPLYGDTRFGATGTIELVGGIIPVEKEDRVYKDFIAEIDLNGHAIYHSSAIPTKFYEAFPTTNFSFDIDVTGFVGSIWIDATTSSTLNTEAWRKAGKPYGSWVWSGSPFTGTIPAFSNLNIGEYQYLRVSYQTPAINGQGASFNVSRSGGTYSVSINAGGTGYGPGVQIKVPGSQLGGVDGTNDLIISVSGVQGQGSSYSVSSIESITWDGTAASGTGQYLVSGTNFSGIIDKITVY